MVLHQYECIVSDIRLPNTSKPGQKNANLCASAVGQRKNSWSSSVRYVNDNRKYRLSSFFLCTHESGVEASMHLTNMPYQKLTTAHVPLNSLRPSKATCPRLTVHGLANLLDKLLNITMEKVIEGTHSSCTE